MSNEVQETVERWNSFLVKIQERLFSILAEADAGFDQVMAYNVTDPASMAGAVTAFESRLTGLIVKISQALEELSNKHFQFASSGEGLPLDELINKGEALQHLIEEEMNEMSIVKRAKAARLLYEIVQEEMAQPRHCKGCNGALEMSVSHSASSITCPYCGDVNQVQTSTAVTNFYFGNAINWLAEEAAIEEWRGMTAQEKIYDEMRSPSVQDKERFRTLTEAYWKKYYFSFAKYHPDWNDDLVGEELQAAMRRFSNKYDN